VPEIKEPEKINKLDESAETNILKGKLDNNCEEECSRGNLNDKKVEKVIEVDKQNNPNKGYEKGEIKETLDNYCNTEVHRENLGGKSGDVNARKTPQICAEDLTTGPHGPDRPIEDVISRAWNPEKGGGPQGRWLSQSEEKKAVANLDVDKMKPGEPYSVPIPKGAGEVIRPYKEYPETKTPKTERIMHEPADRAVVISQKGEIHTYPIGPEHPAYDVPAPTITPVSEVVPVGKYDEDEEKKHI